MKLHFRFFLRTLGIWAISALLAWGVTALWRGAALEAPFLIAAAILLAGIALDLWLRIRALRDRGNPLWQGSETENNAMRYSFTVISVFEGVFAALTLFLAVSIALAH